MRILYLSPGVFDKGGIARYNRFQVRALREGFGKDNVRVFSLMGRQHDDLEEQFEVDFAGAMPLSTETRILFSYEVFRHTIRFRPDFILCALINMGPLAFACSRVVGAKIIQNIYGREIWSSISLLRRRALWKSDLVIADCHNSADKALELKLVKSKPNVIWDCVDTNRYRQKDPDWSVLEKYRIRKTDRFRILFLGRISYDSKYKGYERLLKLISMLPAEKYEAVIAGKGNALEQIRFLSREYGVADRTIITGPIHEADMSDVYNCASAFYLASEAGLNMGEGIPLTPMEAMACGVPVVVGNQDGSRELIENGGGWCGSPYDLLGQRLYLEKLSANPEFHQLERVAARKAAESKFSYERFSKETVGIIERSIS